MDTSTQETPATSAKSVPRSRNRTLALTIGFVFSFAICAGILFTQILFLLGEVLVRSEVPRPADVVLVIGGDYSGERILKAAELVREGFAPFVLESGGGTMYGYYESELALSYVHQHGYTSEKIIPFLYAATSTVDEARHVVPQLREMNVHSYLLVTSPEHTARAGRVFHRVAPDLEIHVVAAPEFSWNSGRWWKTREGRKTWLTEAAKTVADWFRL